MAEDSSARAHTSARIACSDVSDIAGALCSLIAVVLLSSCSSILSRPQPDVLRELPVPKAFSQPLEEGIEPPDAWWESFDDEALNDLIARALEGSPSLRQALSRMEIADASRRRSAAALWPSLDGSIGAGRQRQRFDLDDQTFVFTQSSFDLNLAASYEVDLWGRAAALAGAGELWWRASKSDLVAAAISLTAAVAQAWYDLVAARANLSLLDRQLGASALYLELLELRFEEGVATSADVRRQRLQMEQMTAQRALIEGRVEIAGHSLQAILGGPVGPEGPSLPKGASFPELPSTPDVGLPADLLERRPDILAARHRLEAADQQLAAALAARLPSIRLFADGGLRATSLAQLFETPLWNLMASLAVPLFRGGELAAAADEQEASRDEAAWLYVEVLVEALGEVESALVAEASQWSHELRLRKAHESSVALQGELTERFVEGLIDFFQVLAVIETRQSIEQLLLESKRELISSRIRLHRALAGGWVEAG